MKTAWIVLGILLSAAPAHADQVYRWADESGVVHYTGTPPPPDAKYVQRINILSAPPDPGPLPYEWAQAAKKNPVVLYSSDCGDPCIKAGELLIKRGVPYAEKDAKDPKVGDELKKLTGGTLEVPVLKVGSRVLRWFEADGWDGALDSAGYPKSAPVGRFATPAPAPAAPAAAAPAPAPAPAGTNPPAAPSPAPAAQPNS